MATSKSSVSSKSSAVSTQPRGNQRVMASNVVAGLGYLQSLNEVRVHQVLHLVEGMFKLPNLICLPDNTSKQLK